MKLRSLRNGLLALGIAALLSCGGGGGGGGGVGFPSGVAGGPAAGAPGNASDLGGSDAGATGAAGSSGGTTSGGGSGSDGGTSTAAAGDNGSGVGSGGTGVSTADAGIGSVDGFGSVIVNGLRYDTDTATLRVADAPALQLGMTVKVTGPIDAGFATGTAVLIESAAELRGPSSSIDTAAGTFVVQGTTVTADGATVWADAPGLAGIAGGTTLQVWGLPAAPGSLRATRVQQVAPSSSPIVTGTIQGLNTGLRVFTLGGLRVDYGAAVLAGGLDAASLANGALVRVRAGGAAVAGLLAAVRVEAWNPLPPANGQRVQLAGVATDFAGLGALRVLGTPVDASAASITGGPAGSIGNGVKVEVDGTYANGRLNASKLRIKHVPGTGGPSSFDVSGTVGAFASPASFRVRGQPIDASGVSVAFVNGSAADLRNGVKVSVTGSQIRNGVLLADRVSFD